MYRSVRRLSDAQAAAIKPRRIDVVTVKAGDTAASLSGRMAYSDNKLDRFLVLNGLQANSPLRAGQKVKIVTY
jgi:predicted Zn-dependent protease